MLDVEVARQALAQEVEHSGGLSARLEDDVRRDDVDARRDRPGVEVVDIGYTRRVEDVAADIGHLDALWCGFEEDIDRVAQEAPCARQDQQRDQCRRQRIGASPTGTA